MRQIVLDTETTGLDPAQGHRVIEIGCVELMNRRLTGNNYHQYINPDREIDQGAIDVHGITNEFLADKPLFADIAEDFLAYIDGAELVIHNAPFDVGFLNAEFEQLESKKTGVIDAHCSITDSLKMARKMHPGQKNDLDSLCRRYEVDNTGRTLHGALLDAEILADVYLLMTGGQTGFFEEARGDGSEVGARSNIRRVETDRPRLVVPKASEVERERHGRWLERLDKAVAGESLWRKIGLD